MFLLIQDDSVSVRYGADSLKTNFRTSAAYQLLKQANGNNEIPLCLWDNFIPAFQETQQEDFCDCLRTINNYSREHLDFALNLIRNEIEARTRIEQERIRRERERDRGPCRIL